MNRTAGITAAAATSSRNYCKPLLINLKNFVRIMGSRKLLRLTTQSFSVPKHRLANYPPQNLGGKVTSKVKVVCYWFGGLWFWDFRLCSHAPMLNNERANTARKWTHAYKLYVYKTLKHKYTRIETYTPAQKTVTHPSCPAIWCVTEGDGGVHSGYHYHRLPNDGGSAKEMERRMAKENER